MSSSPLFYSNKDWRVTFINKTDYLSGLHDLLQRRLDVENDIEWSDIAQYMTESTGTPVAKEYCRKGAPLYYLFAENGWVHRPDDVENEDTPKAKSTSLNADGTQSSELRAHINDEDMNDPEYLLKLHGYAPAHFELVSAKASQWGTGKSTLYSSKISVRPKGPAVSQEDMAVWFDRLDRTYSRAEPVKLPGWGEGDKLLILPISDLHFNMQATVFSSGNEYNCEIAEKIFFHIIRDVLDETARYQFKKIIFTIGGDQMDADSPANTTTKGTPQHCDRHYWDACEQMYAMTVKAVDLLAERAPVEVIYVPGNHDCQTGYKLAKYVDAWFRNDDRVSVDYSPRQRHYTVFGKTLFCFTHDADVKRLQKLIPDEARDVWSQVNYTEVFLQHLHSEALLVDECSMRIQRLPSPVAKSVWVDEQGYASRRQCKSFVYDERYGLKNVIYTVIPSEVSE